MTRTRTQGFTLIEAAVAIAVVAILSGIIVPLVVKNLQDSQVARAKNDVQVIAAAVASQMKDTGCRPSATGGPGTSTGATVDALWYSGPALTALPATMAGTFVFVAANSMTNLFTARDVSGTTLGNTLFGTTFSAEFSYKGPYLGTDVALKTDPWGSPYLIHGYNVTQQTANGPIWVVCAGPDKAILAGNAIPAPVTTWAVTAGSTSVDDIVVRVN